MDDCTRRNKTRTRGPKAVLVAGLIGALGLVLTPRLAVAAVGNASITVTGSAGQAIAGATIRLIPASGAPQEAQTDSEGKATITAEEGDYTVVVTEGDSEKREARLTIRPGQTTQLSVTLPGLGPFKGGFPGFTIGSGYSVTNTDLRFTFSEDRATVTIRNVAQSPTVNTQGEGELGALFSTDGEISEAPLIEVDFSDPFRFPAGPPRPTRFGTSLSRGMAVAQGQAAQDNVSERRYVGSATLALGRGRAELRYGNLQTPANSVTWTGEGLLIGAGYRGLVRLCADCGWYAGGRYFFQRVGDIDMTREPHVRVTGGQLTVEEGTLDSSSHTVQGFVGYGFRFAFASAGVRGRFQKATLEGAVEADFSASAGFPVTRRTTFRNEFERTSVEGVFGLDVRIPKTPVFVSLEGSKGPDGSGFSVRAGYGLAF